MIIRKRNLSNHVSTKSKDDGVEVKRVKYEKLTPVILDEDISNYEEPLDFAFSEPDLLNIALSGPYGAGKSSIWKTYEENKGIRDSTIHISLADFNDMEGSDNNKEKSNKEEVNENEHYKEGSSGNIENSEINKIEFQILNQILYQIDEKNAPSAKYKAKREKSMGAKIGTFTLLSMFILGIIFLFFEHQIKSVSRNPLKSFNINFWWLLLTILFLSIPAIFALGRYLNKQLNYFSLSKVGFHNSKIEFDSDNSESLFDRERDEIVYIIRESGISTIVFEDLDRFDNIEIFTKLRHINDLVNINRKDEKKIRFVYMLRDGIFSSRERVKFFDFIIPIVPIIDSSNAKGKFVKMFQEELEGEYSLEKKMLDRISIYVDDMRLLKNIYNEYIIYSNTIDAKGRQLDPNKLLGIITYKNVFPLDYENLQQNKGYVHKLFNEYKKRIDSITDDISEEISQLNDEITDLKNMAEEDYPSLLAAYFHTDRIYQKASEYNTLKEFTKYLLENPEEKYSYKGINSSYWGNNESGIGIIERIEKRPGFDEKRKLLENSKNKSYAIEERETKVRQLEHDIRQLNGMMLKELLGEYIDYSIFGDIDGEVKYDHYFPLIQFLVVNGYIDETYKEYLSYFHEGSITADDQIFLRSIYEGRTLGYDYELDDVLEVLNNLEASDFTREGVLNFHLLNAIISEKKDEFLEQLLENVNRSGSMDFLNGYITVSSDKNKIAFIKKQIEYDRNSLKRWLYAEDVDDKNRFFVIHTVLKMPRDELHYVNEINGLDEYMESNSNILDYYNNNDDIKEVVDGMVELDIKFYDLGSSNSAYNVLIEIEGNDLYHLNPSNVNFIINGLLYSGDKEHSDIMAEQLTLVNSNSELENMGKYIEDNFVDYIGLYIDSLGEGMKLNNSEEDTLLILNSDVDIDILKKFIKYNQTIITDIGNIEDKELWGHIMEEKAISKTYYNAQEYYLEKD